MTSTSASARSPRSPASSDPPGFAFDVADLDAVLVAIEAAVRTQGLESAISCLRRLQDRLSIVETELLASAVSEGASHRETQRLAADNGARTKAETQRRQRHAEAVAANPQLAGSVRLGHLSTGQLDAIADAAARTDGAAAGDTDLLEHIKDLTADQARVAGQNFVERHQRHNFETEHDRQHRLRRVFRRHTPDNLHQLVAEGDKTSIDLAWQQLVTTADALYREDGGRDLPRCDHPRNNSQRMFDAFVEHLTAFPTDATTDQRSTHAGEPGREPGAFEVSSRSPRARRPATVVITTSLDNLLAGAPDAAHLVGSGPLLRERFAQHLADADLVGLLYGLDGHPLHLGRRTRNATTTQRLALRVRDQGCVLCHAHPDRCDAHHVISWNAPAAGPTDIDNLALLCGDCHRQLHHNRQALDWQPERGRWKPRPALPHELPPVRSPTVLARGRAGSRTGPATSADARRRQSNRGPGDDEPD